MKEILLVVGPAALALLIIAILVTWLIVKTRSLNALRESEARAHERSMELLKAANEAALQQQISAIRAEMTAETERLLQQREEALSRKAQETFQTISGSLDKEMKGMKEAFEAQKKSTNESSASLKEPLEGAVRNLAAQTRDIGQKADNLASAPRWPAAGARPSCTTCSWTKAWWKDAISTRRRRCATRWASSF